MPIPACPECGRTDAVQKLTEAFGKDALTSPKGSRNPKLARPEKPVYKGPLDRVGAWVQPIIEGTFENVGCLTGLFVYFISLVAPLMIWMYITLWLAFALTGNEFDGSAPMPRAAKSLWFPMMIVPPVVFFFRDWQKRRAFKREHEPLWLAAVKEWPKRLYCERCDRPFSAGDVPIPLDVGTGEEGGSGEKDAEDRPTE